MPGEDIRLECRVTFTSDPPSKIVWKIDGATADGEEQIAESDGDVVFIKGHLKLNNITKNMDENRVTCEYSKGRYGNSIEAILRVFSLNIDASRGTCDECKGDVKLVFKENNLKSPAESTVDERLKAKIKEVTKVKDIDDISVDESGYSVSAPISETLNNPAVAALTPTLSVGGEQVTKCQCEERADPQTGDGGASLYGLFAIIPAVMIIFLVYWVSPARGGSWGWRRQDDRGGSFQLPSS